jgi:hypothetical protein
VKLVGVFSMNVRNFILFEEECKYLRSAFNDMQFKELSRDVYYLQFFKRLTIQTKGRYWNASSRLVEIQGTVPVVFCKVEDVVVIVVYWIQRKT